MILRISQRRLGFTLLELLLVMAIMVVIVAISVPSFRKTFNDQRLRKAAERVRAECVRTRVKAMKTGKVHVFRCVPESGQFFVETMQQAGDLVNAIATSDETLAGADQVAVAEPTDLSEGISFGTIDTVDGMSLAAEGTSATADALGASLPVYFYPDGTTSTAEVVLRNETKAISVQLRGLTGTARVGDLYLAEEVQ